MNKNGNKSDDEKVNEVDNDKEYHVDFGTTLVTLSDDVVNIRTKTHKFIQVHKLYTNLN